MKTFAFCIQALAIGTEARDRWDGANGSGDSGDYGWYTGGTGASGSDNDGPGGPFSDGADFDVRSAMNIRNIHGVVAAVAFVGLFPLGAILMRVVPGRFAWILHALTQALGYVIYIAAAGLGIYMVQMLEMSQTNAHPTTGLVVLAALFFQPLLGWIHHIKFKHHEQRTTWSHAHIWIGRIVITLGIINGALGLQLAGASSAAIIAYAVSAAIMWFLWAIAAISSEFKRRKITRNTAAAGQVIPPYTPGPVSVSPPPPRIRVGRSGGDIEMRTAKPVNRDVSVSSMSS
ncbi:hypothetical protein BJ170DRAFT_631185 [Xylariales sp. AK1849]|nr:hypothetical protein BJ170DRAFT_631185 [Xylariales sp. AK1849]